MLKTLLLTWTIKPSLKTLWKNSSDLDFLEREKSYIKAIVFYITQSDFDQIIFWENSWYNISIWSCLEALANKYNKKIEIIQFLWNPLYPEKYWYWCWEAEIFDYIIDNSKLIKNTDCFYKITGRYILLNVNDILKKLDSQKNYFHKQWLFASPLWVSTAFFKVSLSLYKKYLYEKHILFFERFFSSDIKLNKVTKYPYLSIEYVRYLLMRKYLKGDYTKENNTKLSLSYYSKIPTYWFWIFFRTIIYDLYVYVWLSEFNLFHKLIDFLLYKIKYSWVSKMK